MHVNARLETFKMEIHTELVSILSKTMELDDTTKPVMVNGGREVPVYMCLFFSFVVPGIDTKQAPLHTLSSVRCTRASTEVMSVDIPSTYGRVFVLFAVFPEESYLELVLCCHLCANKIFV